MQNSLSNSRNPVSTTVIVKAQLIASNHSFCPSLLPFSKYKMKSISRQML